MTNASIVGIILCLAGLLIAFRGHSLYRTSMGLIGFCAGAIFIYRLTAEMTPLVALVACLVGGFVCAAVMIFVYRVSVFTLGAVAIAQVITVDPAMLIIIALGAGGGLVALILEKAVVATATAALGAYAVVSGASLLMSRIPLGPEGVWPTLASGELVPRETIHLVAFAGIALLGIGAQLRGKKNTEPEDE
jgi:hypothetical protein